MDLAKFLEARIADDEALGRRDLDSTLTLRYSDADSNAQWLMLEFDAERVLREVDAKRKIVAEHAMDPGMFPPSCVRCCDTNTAQYPQRWDALMWPCPTVRALAAVWSDHEDYDQIGRASCRERV